MSNHSCIYFDVRDKKHFKQEQSKNLQIKPSFDLKKENGEIILGRELFYLGRGENSTVWKYEYNGEEYAIKIFYNTSLLFALDIDVFKIMKSLPLENTIKPISTLKIINSSDNNILGYDAYMMEFIDEKKDYSIVEMPTSKLLENARILEKDSNLLAESKIVMHDTKKENAIFNNVNSNIYISDIDMFFIANYESTKGVIESNYMELNYMFYELLSQYSSEYYSDIYNEFFEDLFFKSTTNKNAVSSNLEYLFSSYDTPKQFFKDNKKSYIKKYF